MKSYTVKPGQQLIKDGSAKDMLLICAMIELVTTSAAWVLGTACKHGLLRSAAMVLIPLLMPLYF